MKSICILRPASHEFSSLDTETAESSCCSCVVNTYLDACMFDISSADVSLSNTNVSICWFSLIIPTLSQIQHYFQSDECLCIFPLLLLNCDVSADLKANSRPFRLSPVLPSLTPCLPLSLLPGAKSYVKHIYF